MMGFGFGAIKSAFDTKNTVPNDNMNNKDFSEVREGNKDFNSVELPDDSGDYVRDGELPDDSGDSGVTDDISRDNKEGEGLLAEAQNETRQEDSHLNCPRENGHWEDGEDSRGESKWISDRGYVPPDNGKGNNPEGKSMGQILDKYDIDGIVYKDGEPDFADIREGEPVKIEGFSDNRSSNFRKADMAYAERYNKDNPDNPITPGEVKAYREENKLTWHEHRDCSTMEMIPSEIHGNFSHRGGISELKSRSES